MWVRADCAPILPLTHRQLTDQVGQLPTPLCRKDRRVRGRSCGGLGVGDIALSHRFPHTLPACWEGLFCLPLRTSVASLTPCSTAEILTTGPHLPSSSTRGLSISGLFLENLTSPLQNDRLSFPCQSPTSPASRGSSPPQGILPFNGSSPEGVFPPFLPLPPLPCPPGLSPQRLSPLPAALFSGTPLQPFLSGARLFETPAPAAPPV